MNSVTPGKTAVYSAGQPFGQRCKAKAYQYARLMRLDRPIGTFLLLWPMLWALWIAGAGHPDPGVTLVFLLGALLMRSAGCALNDFADRKFDPDVARTRDRPLAAGKLAPREAVMVFVVLSLIAFALVLTMNLLTVQLACIGAGLAAIYPFTKRYTYLPQVFMGLAFGWAVPMVWAAQTGEVNAIGWLLYLAAVLWATIYDTQYAMVDRDDDLRIGVKSMAILFGPADRLMIGVLQIVFLLTLLIIGRQTELGIWYYLGVLVAVALFLYQQHLMRDRRPAGCFKAFLNNHWLGAALFAGTVLHYLFSA